MYRWVGCAIAFAASSGCYSPSYVDCAVTCASGFGCPSGLTCDTSVNACRAPAMVGQACGATADAGIDAACEWKGIYPASNFNPCSQQIPPAVAAMMLSGVSTFDTDGGKWTTATSTVNLPGAFVSSLWLLHTSSFTLEQDSIINLVGKTPLLIVADSTISIAGNLDATAPSGAEFLTCGMPDGAGVAIAGVGGGGGGYGASGASGGSAGGSPVEPGEGANGDPMLATLRPGCQGGTGGSPMVGLAGGLGGSSGGAFGLVAGMSIEITDHGTLLAGGGGGGGGSNTLCGGVPCSSGGGGGGAGGSILLEAPMIAIDGAICAAGGGGGQGGVPGFTAGTAPNADECHGGTPGSGNGTTGGTGGDTATPSGGDGAPATNPDSGGGGGGSVGRVYLHALAQPGTGQTALFLPPPVVNSN